MSPRVSTADVLHRLPGATVRGAATHAVVNRIVENHDDVRPGDLFVAIRGGMRHGASHAVAAVAAGAVAVLTDPEGADLMGTAVGTPIIVVENPRATLGPLAAWLRGHPAKDLDMLAVTGTNGKTTTAYVLEAALRRLGRRPGLLSTPEVVVGDTREASRTTTPPAPQMQELLAGMRDAGNDACVMEVSSHALDQHRVDGIRFAVAAFTNLSHEHLDYHGDMDQYFHAKARLFTPALASRAVVVTDDAAGRRLAELARHRGVPVVTVSNRAEVTADWHVLGRPGEDTLRLSGPHEQLLLHAPLPGEHNRTNTAVAALMLMELGFPARDVRAALAGPVSVPGRMERVDLGPGWPTVVIDFAHTPDATSFSVRALRARTAGRLVVTASSGGDRDTAKRELTGAAVVDSGADVVVVTDDNPRSEDPAAIRAAVTRGVRRAAEARGAAGLSVPQILEAPTRPAAIRWALEVAGPGGTVALYGRGHERWMEIGPTGHRVPFVDRDQVRAAAAEIARAADAS